MNKTKWEQGVYKPEDFMPKKRVRLSTRKTNKGKKYWTKRFDMRFKQTLLGLSIFCLVVGIIGAVSTYHTKKYNSIMAEYQGFQERYEKRVQHDKNVIEQIKNESISFFKTPVAKAEGLTVEKPVQKIKKPMNQYENIKRVAKVECDKKGFGEWCVDDLIAIAHNEKADFDCDSAVGDGGVSHGCFQINFDAHDNITVEQARDVNFAVPWTLNRMVHYGYPTKRSYAIMRHNGRAYIPETLEYLRKVNEYIKNN